LSIEEVLAPAADRFWPGRSLVLHYFTVSTSEGAEVRAERLASPADLPRVVEVGLIRPSGRRPNAVQGAAGSVVNLSTGSDQAHLWSKRTYGGVGCPALEAE
jgi:hypothetical protein